MQFSKSWSGRSVMLTSLRRDTFFLISHPSSGSILSIALALLKNVCLTLGKSQRPLKEFLCLPYKFSENLCRHFTKFSNRLWVYGFIDHSLSSILYFRCPLNMSSFDFLYIRISPLSMLCNIIN